MGEFVYVGMDVHTIYTEKILISNLLFNEIVFPVYVIFGVSFCYIGRPYGGRIEGRSAANKQSVTLIIYAQSPAVIARVKQAIESQCTAECPDVVLDSKDNQEAITKLTPVEVMQNEKLSNVHC